MSQFGNGTSSSFVLKKYAIKVSQTFDNHRALVLSTFAFTGCFAVWTIFGIIGIQIKQDLSLSDTQFGILVATPILTGSISRLFFGIWADQFGGRLVFSLVMVVTALATFLLTYASSYLMFIFAALGLGLAGGSFSVGVAYVSNWYPKENQGTVLGIFGVGNVGAAFTNFVAPILMLSFGWEGVARIYSAMLLVIALLFVVFTKDDPALEERKRSGKKPPSMSEQLQPLKNIQVWRFSLYYFFVFGAFVALALWLPRYYMGVYGLEIQVAGMLSALYAMPGSIFRALGGWASDKWGARKVMYWSFIASVICCFIMSYPSTEYIVQGINDEIRFTLAIGLVPFVILSSILGFFMSLGTAAVYKHIPAYYPNHVGSVGGIVGLIGGLGGFVLPISFGLMNDIVGIWTSCFMLLLILTTIALTWMHFAIIYSLKKHYPAMTDETDLPELENKEK